MNLNAKVHPGIVALVLLLTAVAIGIKMWADGKVLDLSGPAQLLAAPSGHVYIQIQDQLLEHDASGMFLRRIDLAEMGVDTVIGGLAFFPGGDILLRRGRDSRGIFDSLRAYGRLENTSDIRSPEPDIGLARCSLADRMCEPFGDPTIDFKATFSAFVDDRNEIVYVSDTSRHRLRVFTFGGEEIATPREGFRFPNELLLHEEALLVADTNHHRIALIEHGKDLAGELVAIDVVPEEAESRGERWPSHFALVDDRWWVNNMQSDMRDGGVYVFDREFTFEKRLPLPEGADPIAILPFGQGALISDWDNDRVHYVARSGELLGDFQSPGLESVLAETREQRRYYAAVSWLGIALFILIFAGIFVKAALQPREQAKDKDDEATATAGAPPETWVWFRPRPKAVRKLLLSVWVAGAALFSIVVLLVVVSVVYDKPSFALSFLPLLAGLAAMTLLTVWMSRANAYTEIGLRGDQIILRDHRGRESHSALQHVSYSDTTLATSDMAVVLGRPQMPLYDKQEIESGLLPFLTPAKKITEAQMQMLLVRLRHPNGVMFAVAILLALAVFAKYLADKMA